MIEVEERSVGKRRVGPLQSGALSLALGLLVAGPAAGQLPEYGPYHRPPNAGDEWDAEKGSRATRLATGHFVHDGFYFRFAGGIGGVSDKLTGDARDSDGPSGTLDGSVSGFAPATEVALGYTFFRGWVFGVAIDTLTMPRGSATLADGVSNFKFKTSQSAHYAIFADYYLDPLRGFHVQASGGIASYVMGQGDANDPPTIAPPHAAMGFGFMLGVGNQWWLDRDWSIGVLPRLMLAWTSGTDEFGGSFSHRTLGYSLLLSATYH